MPKISNYIPKRVKSDDTSFTGFNVDPKSDICVFWKVDLVISLPNFSGFLLYVSLVKSLNVKWLYGMISNVKTIIPLKRVKTSHKTEVSYSARSYDNQKRQVSCWYGFRGVITFGDVVNRR